MPFKFGKKTRYSIGEKKAYFNQLLSNPTVSENKSRWATLRLKQLSNKTNSLKLGDVYIVSDKLMGNHQNKPRLAVVAKVDKNNVTVIPVKKDNKLLGLSKFDEQRALHITNNRVVSDDDLYEIRGFKIAKNAYLTYSEKSRLLKKVDKYL